MTDDRLLVRRGAEPWATPEVSAYSDEAHLQSLLAADPARVPGVGPGAFAVRELSTEAGPVDVCIVEAHGEVTVVECKLATNSERRRMVIGQVLDYAAAIWSTGPDGFEAGWRARGGDDLGEALEPDGYQRLRTYITEGRLHLCLAVDLIDAEIRRLIEFLNRITRPDIRVTALQLTYARHGDVEILVPTTFGGELAAAKNRERTSGERWSRERFLEAITSDVDRTRVTRLLELLDSVTERVGQHDPLWFGAYPGGGIYFQPYGVQYAPFYIWLNSKGRVVVNGAWNWFQATKGHPGFAPLAHVLGQDYDGKGQAVPVTNIDVDTFWAAALETALAINQPQDDGPRT